MTREQNLQTAQRKLFKLVQQRRGPDAIANAVESCVRWDHAEEEALEELVQWLIMLRNACRHGSLQPHFPISRLLVEFKDVAQRRNISPEKFYSALSERIFLEPELDECSRNQPRHSTKDKILNAALEVFSEKGFHLATVDIIAERAGVGKGTLYRYFANKENLFNEMIRLRLEELEENAQAILNGQDDVLTMITKYVRIYFEFFDRNQRLYRLIVQERLDVGEQVQDVYLKKVMRRIPVLKRKIYGASQQGVLKEVDFQTVFYGVMGFIHGVIQKWLARDCSYPLVEELPTVIEVLFYGFVKNDRQGKLNQEVR